MRKITPAIALVMFALLTSGCASLGMHSSVDKAAAANMHNIAVYSTFSDQMNHTFVGTTIFSNSSDTLAVPQWKIAEFSQNEMAAALVKAGVG